MLYLFTGGVKRFTFSQPGRRNSESGEDGFEGGERDWSLPGSSRPSNRNPDNSAFHLSDMWSIQNLNVDHLTHKSDGHSNYAQRQYYSRHGGLSEANFEANIKHPLTTKHAPVMGDSKTSWKRPAGQGFSYSLHTEDSKPATSERHGLNDKLRQGSMGNIQSTGMIKGGLYSTELQKSRRF
ncbi:hypothetical protein NP493_707g00020 [Ridgeia piscesae]|uniref:Uncharacterized protein n=1 Tax=Ridgeia piscesae TaxID=27915 RepID=A0AAD9KQS4_RIDPI|nr:hypothetical protein NP493_707g00020 [Ridgeia piscesae]